MKEMHNSNQTSASEFIILGFSEYPHASFVLFPIFLLIYLISLLGNLTLVLLVWVDPHLHCPMYFFLSQLSVVDISYTSAIFPSMLLQIITRKNAIPFSACMSQLYFFFSFASIECLILTVMAIDRYFAICHPLRYISLMTRKMCFWMTAISWILGFLDPIVHTVLIARLAFCASNRINHFFCDVTVLLKLACNDTYPITLATFLLGSLLGFTYFLLTLASYLCIISAILKIPSKDGRCQAFSTCASHLTVLILYYMSMICVYLRPTSAYSPNRDRFLAILYTAVIPMCNPLIYSLRNADVQRAMQRAIGKKRFFFSNTSKTSILSVVGKDS
ncbi:olfactory receptor 5AP2-like [Pleurodeles waltl]|uniref:olfactory receptor 5AP2-like n=1 Tax=Pleurodeles waltl TaxID=8319 RepID=UPI003709B9F6